MRTKAALLALFWSVPAAAGTAGRLPPGGWSALPAVAADAQGFVPHGWTIETQARGDLDGDGAPDLAFILLAPDIPGAPRASGPYDGPTAYANPRMLGVALARPGGGYRLVVSNHSFLPRKWAPNGASQGWMLFGNGSLEAKAGRLRFLFEYTRGHRTFTFRWLQGALRLIGYDSAASEGGCVREISVNFLSRRARFAAARIDGNAERVQWKRLQHGAPTLERIGEGEEFDPERLLTRTPMPCPTAR